MRFLSTPRTLVKLACVLASMAAPADASWPDSARPLPAPTGRIVRVSTEAQLQAAVGGLRSDTTILVAPGVYSLSRTLAVNGPLTNVAIRGATNNRDDVTFVGPGRDNKSFGDAANGIWIGGDVRGVMIANLTVRDFYYHPIIVNPGPSAPRFYNVHLLNGGEQLIKVNPNADQTGANDGIVEYSVLEHAVESRNWYTNAVDVLGGARWIIRHNLIKNIRAPNGETAGPAILMWAGASETIVEGNTFVNCQREIAFGLAERTPNDHSGGVIRNNFIYRDAGMRNGDTAIGVWDSPGTRVLHNTILITSDYPNAIEYRFRDTVGVEIANNLVDRAIVARDGAAANVHDNLTPAPEWFVNAASGDLHLRGTAVGAIDRGAVVTGVPLDWDNAARPVGSAPDVGADELGSGPPSAPMNLRIVPASDAPIAVAKR